METSKPHAIDDPGVAEFVQIFRRFLEEVVHQDPRPRGPLLLDVLQAHLGADPRALPVFETSYPAWDHANAHLALERWFGTPGSGYELVGVALPHRHGHDLTELLHLAGFGGGLAVGQVDFAQVAVEVEREIACVNFGFVLGRRDDEPYAVLVRGPSERHGSSTVNLEVLCRGRDTADALFQGLRQLILEHNTLRGQVLSFEGHAFGHGTGPLRFHRRPAMGSAEVVLPAGLLDRVERQIVGVARHRDRLRGAGQHLRRGLLLHGAPGTGKTHTIRYLLSRLPEFTVVILAGTSIQFVGAACTLARMLQPALVVLEDCDLVAEARDMSLGMENPLLFQVLNEMDGLTDEADVAFLLTTNRADLLEPALAQRPGRVDLAVEIPLPDADGRRRLMGLYAGNTRTDEHALGEAVTRTEGTTASFAKELMRRAVLFAVERDGVAGPNGEPVSVEAGDLRMALDELLADRDALTRRLLGSPVQKMGSVEPGGAPRSR
ncbi:AAA family ATPase [Actinopolymorpha pittospori]